MIRALEALQRTQNALLPPKKAQEAIAALQISSYKRAGWMRFFSSHPPLAERIARLRDL